MGEVINPSTTHSFIGNQSITSEKLSGSANYLSWAASVKMWFKGQGRSDHLTKRAIDIAVADRPKWEQIDAQLCNLLWQSIDPSIIQLFRLFETCYDVWTEASECYTNDIQRLYTVVYNIQNLKQDGSMESYLGHIRALMQEFEALMPFVNTRVEQTAQREKFFMVAALSGLKPEFEAARHQILTSSTAPTMKDTFRRLLNMTSTHTTKHGPTPSAFMIDPGPTPVPSVFASGSKKGNNGKRPSCDFCNRLGHTEDKCWKKHGRPAAPPTPTSQSIGGSIHAASSTQTVNLSSSDYEAFLRFQAAQHSTSTATSHTGNPSAYATQRQSINPWIVDSGATDHLCGPEHRTDDWRRA